MQLSSLLFPFLVTASNAYTSPLNCAANDGIMTTPTYGTSDAIPIFTVCAQITISSIPSAIYKVLLDFPLYPAWNTFVYSVDLPAGVSSAADVYVGMNMTFHTYGLIPVLNSTSTEVVTYLEPDAIPPFMAWRDDAGEIGDVFLQAEHVSVLNDLGGGTTEYVSWETYYGVGALALLALEGNLRTEFMNQATDLKARVESLQS